MNEFKIGDKVEIGTNADRLHGMHGIITYIYPRPVNGDSRVCMVKLVINKKNRHCNFKMAVLNRM